MYNIGVPNKRAIKGVSRPTYIIDVGNEFIIKSGGRSFIIRGTKNSLQIFGKDYASEGTDDIFAGTINGVVVGLSFNIGYDKDIVVKDIETIEV